MNIPKHSCQQLGTAANILALEIFNLGFKNIYKNPPLEKGLHHTAQITYHTLISMEGTLLFSDLIAHHPLLIL